jgi:hypothetical protein
LFYFRPQTGSTGQLLAVKVNVTPGGLSADVPSVLFEGAYLGDANGPPNYDVFRDGQRFVMIQNADGLSDAHTPLVVVLNWFEELKRLVPVN